MYKRQLQLLIFSLPSLVFVVFARLRGKAWRQALRDVGWTAGKPADYLRALGALALLAAIAYPVLRLVPAELMRGQSGYEGLRLTPVNVARALIEQGIYIALGEEILFRGLLAGWLQRRLGFAVGNWVQALIFLAPHLLLLTVSKAIWPVFIVQLAAGWLQGWLRYRADSILPGWLVHTASNVSSALSAMLA